MPAAFGVTVSGLPAVVAGISAGVLSARKWPTKGLIVPLSVPRE